MPSIILNVAAIAVVPLVVLVSARAVRTVVVLMRLVTTTVSTVPAAAAVVVVIVAVPVTSPYNRVARPITKLLARVARIQTHAVVAAQCVAVCTTATIAPIPATSTVVVPRVAEHIALVRSIFALTSAAFVAGVETRTFCAVHVVAPTTAVAPVPATSTHVVFVVAHAIRLPRLHVAAARATGVVFGWIQAGAILAVIVCVHVTTAVAAVPTAAAIVVTVVTLAVSCPLAHLAGGAAMLGVRV